MKMKTKLLAALVALVLALGAHAELCVSEICPKPKGFDPNGFESGWIELYNAGDEPVNLSSYTLERFNRGKAAKAGSYAALPDVTVPAKGYQVVYTSEEYPAAVNDGKTPFVYEGCVVVPFKVNPKKYPLVRLLKGADVLESFVVPVELDNDKSFAPAGGVFPEYTAPGVQPALPQPPAAVEIAVDPTKVTTDEAKGVTAVDAAASVTIFASGALNHCASGTPKPRFRSARISGGMKGAARLRRALFVSWEFCRKSIGSVKAKSLTSRSISGARRCVFPYAAAIACFRHPSSGR